VVRGGRGVMAWLGRDKEEVKTFSYNKKDLA